MKESPGVGPTEGVPWREHRGGRPLEGVSWKGSLEEGP